MFRQKNIKVILSVFISGLLLASINFSSAKETSPKYPGLCAIYITGIGCSNCAITDPLIFSKLLAEYDNLIVIEYEIYKSASANKKVVTEYFKKYLPSTSPGVPFFLLGKNSKALGSKEINKIDETLRDKEVNLCPMPSGQNESFNELDLNSLPGDIKIWHKDRILISEDKGGSSIQLKKILISSDVDNEIRKLKVERVEPKEVFISRGKIIFDKAAKIEGWVIQWGQKEVVSAKPLGESTKRSSNSMPGREKALIEHINSLKNTIRTKNLYIGLEALIILILTLLLFRKKINLKKIALVGIPIVTLVLFFFIAKNVPSDFLKNLGTKIPLPVFTFVIALVDGFNPCNLFVLTLLLALLVSASDSKKKIYAAGFTFVFVVFLFYFLFMAAWLNIFKCLGFFTPIRITIGIIAILAGIINCKDFFFFKKGISLTIGDRQRGVLIKKMNRVRKIAEEGSLFMLILSSLGLAVFSSCVELPCTAGFPIIFTTILVNKGIETPGLYYLYILFYNLIYVLPLLLVVLIFGYTFQVKKISQKQIEVIKLIGGIIMIALGLVLIINPQIIGIGLQ
jgi:cytochrome c biogenesis protein CcdA